MKKQLICVLAAAAMLPGATVFAAGSYDPANNNVTVDENAKQTVIIARNTGSKMTDDDIVYVGQNKDGFSAATFMLKKSPAAGVYTIMLGGDGNAVTTGIFFIGNADNFNDNKVELTEIPNYEVESEDGKYVTKAYASDGVIDLANAKSIIVKYGNKSLCTEVGTGGSGDMKLAVELNGIPIENKENVKVWISSTEVSSEPLIIQ